MEESVLETEFNHFLLQNTVFFPSSSWKNKNKYLQVVLHAWYELDSQSTLRQIILPVTFSGFAFSFEVSNGHFFVFLFTFLWERACARGSCVYLAGFSLSVTCFNCHDVFYVTGYETDLSCGLKEKSCTSLKESEHNTLIWQIMGDWPTHNRLT